MPAVRRDGAEIDGRLLYVPQGYGHAIEMRGARLIGARLWNVVRFVRRFVVWLRRRPRLIGILAISAVRTLAQKYELHSALP
jgi:hypothetical protein